MLRPGGGAEAPERDEAVSRELSVSFRQAVQRGLPRARSVAEQVHAAGSLWARRRPRGCTGVPAERGDEPRSRGSATASCGQRKMGRQRKTRPAFRLPGVFLS